jgi:hypothetical protein
MLPFSHEVIKGYNNAIREDRDRSSYLFRRMYEDINAMANKATGRVGIELTSVNDAILAMTDDNIGKVSREAIPSTQQGDSHGPSKGGNYPQKSLAVLMGLGQFGVSRIVFRDEVHNNQVERYVGPIRSIILFDEAEPVMNGKDGIIYPTDEWKKFLYRLTDYTDIKPDINKHRYCTYIPQDDVGCSKCIEFCPSGAQINSVPLPNGEYSKQVLRQSHRFWEDQLQFDYAKCCEIRGQMAALFPEWSCARCVTICAEEGTRRKNSVLNYYDKKMQLTTRTST